MSIDSSELIASNSKPTPNVELSNRVIWRPILPKPLIAILIAIAYEVKGSKEVL